MSFKIVLETKIDVAVEKLFEFHQDTTNLPLITPKNIDVKLIKVPQTFEEKSVVVLDITKYGMTQRWEVELNTIIFPTLIRDVAYKSPFKSFVHDHCFESCTPTSSLLRDIIKITLPFEPLSTMVQPLIKKDIIAMFTYRHAQTKKVLESLV